ncbi:Probable ATP-dependent helicase dinG homolog [uncultured Clostridium sp.]|uniref:helicase C-terminal domain-containing protein n=1 Tax=uncultured Clostridium sp. TaxID=59620 RepID=UPI000820A241|nr:helicase C-terminal domain-containing protein [uncultured Clostridium sp.]SCK03054.1 Probable ATP-dependent helicase dinG homolog [uncultured Clostridium sp.]
MKYKSVLDNIVYIDIETTGLNPINSEIIEIGALRIKNSVQSKLSILIKPTKEVPKGIYHLCDGLKDVDLNNGYTLNEAKRILIEFIRDLPLICHNKSFEESFFSYYFPEVKNIILDSMELACILEPSRKSFNVEDLLNGVTTIREKEKHRGLEDSIHTMLIVNSLLCRLWQKEEEVNRINSLYNELNKLFINRKPWGWIKYLLKPIMFDSVDYPYILYKETFIKPLKINSIKINYEDYEKLLRNENIWSNGGDFKYQYRPDQESISFQIRENYEKSKRIFIEAPTGSGKTFAYLLIAIIVSYLNKQNKNFEDSNFVISTDTKELQNQLIDKDIPNILRKLKLYNKISFGAMKGKGNYICMERLKKSKEFEEDENSLLSFLFLKRYGEEGTSGDLENINFWALNHFHIEKYKNHINCDSENCNLDRCKTICFLKNRYNELPRENITVVNHSLLASWPYSEKRKVNHLIIDEAHNLMEKAHDFFSEEFNSYEFSELIKQINETTPSIIFLLKRLNGLYNYKNNIDSDDIINKSKDISISIAFMLNEFRRIGFSNGKYNFNDEFFNPEEALRNSSEIISDLLSSLKMRIYRLYKVLADYIKSILDEDEKDSGNEYRILNNYIMKLRSSFDIIDNFLTYSKEYAKVIDIDKEFQYFIIKNIPLNISKLINENMLNEVKSTVFISATLRINNSFQEVKRVLGQKDANTFWIKPVFNLKHRTKIFTVKDIGSYKNEESFAENTAKLIYNVALKTKGHILVLFSNNLRRENVMNKLNIYSKGTELEIYNNKKAIQYLKDKNRQVVILGSKGFFEGIDIPGDSLSCVVIDKIPNINPTDPVYKALKAYTNIFYSGYNYPKVCIKLKQGYGRLIRSIYDYGYFIILDGGNNRDTLKKLEIDLNGPIIYEKWSKEIVDRISIDFDRWKKENFYNIIKEVDSKNIKESFNDISQKMNLYWECLKSDSKDELKFKNNEKNFKIKIDNIVNKKL